MSFARSLYVKNNNVVYNNEIPIGGIILWSGSIVSIPLN